MKKFLIKYLDDDGDQCWTEEKADSVSQVIGRFNKDRPCGSPTQIFEIANEWKAEVSFIKA